MAAMFAMFVSAVDWQRRNDRIVHVHLEAALLVITARSFILSGDLFTHTLIAGMRFMTCMAASELGLLDGCKIRRIVSVIGLGLGLGLGFGGRLINIEFSIGLQAHYLTPLRPALIQMVNILLVQFVDGSHVVVHNKVVVHAVEAKLLQRLIEGKPIEYSLVHEMLLEMDGLAVLDIRIVLDDIDQVDDHLRL